VLQIVGALMVLAAFVAVQFRVIQPRSYLSLLLNLTGSGILAVLAYEEQLWGFLLLEGVLGPGLPLGRAEPRHSGRAVPCRAGLTAAREEERA
jgi:hypothetical protein